MTYELSFASGAVAAAPASVPTNRVADEAAAARRAVERLEANVSRVLRGKAEVVRKASVCLLSGGHLLVEDVPGVGKTTLAHALARSLGVSFQRIQFTSDLLPSDIIGVSVYRQQSEQFEFVPGPLFCNVLLADEINRATPKTQSALLEAMSEGQVSIDRKRYALKKPFLVIGTQNPMDYHGTFPLPESQLDRFLMSLEVGYPPREEERNLLLSGGVESALASLEPALSGDDLRRLQEQVKRVEVAPKLADYMLTLAEETRGDGPFLLGVSTRGVQGLYRAAQALALCEGRDFAVPDDVQRLAPAVLSHRVVLRRGAAEAAAQRHAIEDLLASVPVPL